VTTRSQLDYAKEFEACETEDLRHTNAIQAGFRLLALKNGEVAAYSDTLNTPSSDLIEALLQAEPVGSAHGHYRLMKAEGPVGLWLKHTHKGVDIYEQPVLVTDPPIIPDIQAALDHNHAQTQPNLYKYSQRACQTLRTALQVDRVMVYRFHTDWSGEVIAEALDPTLDPFLGLFYPPTDIPRQARELYLELGSRHIFSTHRANSSVRTLMDGDTIDLSLCASRSVSPFHLEYLRNMGTESTASCSILVNGRLWGLLSMHYATPRSPRLEEVIALQTASHALSGHIRTLIEDAEALEQSRQDRTVSLFKQHLDDISDPFASLMLSDVAVHRVLNTQGASLIIDRKMCNVGQCPTPEGLEAILARHGEGLADMETCFVQSLDLDVPTAWLNSVAGCALVQISRDPNVVLVLHRTELNQQVSWGGDPRRQDSQDDPALRYTPRRSFETWVENVSGHSAPWTDRNKALLMQLFQVLNETFEVSARELALLIRNGLRQAALQKQSVRDTAMDLIDGIQVAIAVAVEDAGEGSARVIALNQSAAEAFAIGKAEAKDLSLDTIAVIGGLDLPKAGAASHITSITSAARGVRQCEVKTNTLIEFLHRDDAEPPYRVQVIEFRDITESTRLEASLLAARDRALRDSQLQEEFFAKLSHELKTPLNGLVGLSDLLIRYELDHVPESVSKKLHMLRDMSLHMSALITSTLDNASAIQSVNKDNFINLDTRELLQTCEQMLRDKLLAAQLSLTIEDTAYAQVHSDPRGVIQVLVNILTNAIKYNVPDGQIRIWGEQEARGLFKLYIADTGTGMSADQVDRCMAPYTRFSTGEGAGLGLSISNNLMKIMGGVIQIQSEPGEGTTVELTLPTQPVAPDGSALV